MSRRAKTHPPEVVERALTMARAGKSDPFIALAMGIPRCTIGAWRRQAGIEAAMPGRARYAVGDQVGGCVVLAAEIESEHEPRYRVRFDCCESIGMLTGRQIASRVKHQSTWCMKCAARRREQTRQGRKRRVSRQTAASGAALSPAQQLAMSGRWV